MSSIFNFKLDMSPIERELKNMANTNNEKFNRAVLVDGQDILLNYIRQLAPKKSGKYAKSWKKGQIVGKKAEVRTSAGKLFALLEFTGAKPQTRVRSPGQGPYVFKSESGEVIFTMKINWPGFDNIPHVRPAMKRLEKNFRIILAANMSKYSIIFNKVSNQNKSKVNQLKKERITRTANKQSKSKQTSNRGSTRGN